ncbi:sulfite reductase [Ilyomonas limi]|uniref:assimilatory sulfite reductase (NADPH) n=1 Tax=Ilyomonas limi TaxID=2575867 RepID=A0A4U3KZ19_9BACT|nr:flavodoxin domain-containing protein [Ilyomonas limi]TKK67760.1 sulfite reductase [Ilyomonas limi]
MLAEPKLKLFRELITGVSKEELIWINGYVSALMESNGHAANVLPDAAPQSTLAVCTVVYGTESGNSKKVAVEMTSKLKKQGVQVKTKSLDQYRVADLPKENCLLVVMSTQGDGEPPAAAKKFYDYIQQNDVQLGQLKFGVLALGDSSYPLFCKAGEDVDERLERLGAERIIPLCKCDTDFEPEAHAWIDELINTTLKAAPAAQPAKATVKPASAGKKIQPGKIVTSVNLNDIDSNKETYHIEIATEEPIIYEPGDSIGIIAKNSDAAVMKILELLDASPPEQTVAFKNESYKLFDLFKHKINIQYLPERIIQKYAALAQKEIPAIRMDLIDLLRIYPFDQVVSVQQLVDILDPVAPRLYSIASSPAAHGENEVHITVGRSSFEVDSQKRFGLCSDYLSCMNVNDILEIYVQRNSSFKLPHADTDIIMIGPGTGIAPFRSFLFERDATGAQGRNWLFFGDQHFTSDFLYQTELLTLFETGTLTRFNTAFSRDQQEKIYVQHRMLQQATELFEWIKNGASIYVCGAKYPMSTDVENTLLQIIQTKGNMNEEEAMHFLNELSEHGKYHKDVY